MRTGFEISESIHYDLATSVVECVLLVLTLAKCGGPVKMGMHDMRRESLLELEKLLSKGAERKDHDVTSYTQLTS